MLALAWRNLWRQRRRSATTVGAVALVVAFALLYYGIGGAMVNSMYRDLTAGSGQVQVHVPGWRDATEPSRALVRDADAVRARILATLQGPSGAAPDAEVAAILDVPGLLIHGERSRALAIQGVAWPPALRERYLARNTLEGSFPDPSGAAPGTDGIVLGRALATALAVAPGDRIDLYAPGTSDLGGYGVGTFTVTGVLDMLDPGAEGRTAIVALPVAQAVAAPDAVSRFEIHLPGLVRVDEDVASDRVAGALEGSLPGLEVATWRQLSPDLVRLLHAFGPMMAIITLIFFVLAGLLVVNTVYLGLIERIREFGVLLALGLGGRRVMRLIATESVLLCLTGAAIGLAVGLGGVAILARGFTFPGFEAYFAGFGIDPMLYASVHAGQVALAFGFALGTGVLAALWPASLASRLEPVEAMRFTA